jgi:hypothetical protein
MVKIGSKLFKKTHFPTKFDEIFQMVPILICFEEKKFWRYFATGGTLTQKYSQKLFSSKHINMGTI